MQVLEGLEAVRKRPGMYIGSTDSKGLNHLVAEIADNSVDEALAGYADKIIVTLFPDNSVQVEDNGRGIPTDLNEKIGLTGVEIAYQKLHGGGKFGGAGYKSAGGLHGVGASVVNALSERLDVTVYRNNKESHISFKRGHAGKWDSDGLGGKFTPQKGLTVSADKRKAADKKARATGTTVRWWFDKAIFLKDAHYNLEALLTRFRQTAFIVKGLTVEVHDLRDKDNPINESFFFEGGIVDMVDYMTAEEKLHKPIHLTGIGGFTETVPVLDSTGEMKDSEVHRDVEVDVAFAWNQGYDTNIKSFVNVVNTPNGGTHVKGFESALSKVILDSIKTTRGMLKAKETTPTLDDIREGLTAVVSIKQQEPQFIGQTKDELGTAGVRKAVLDVVKKELSAVFDNRKNSSLVKTIDSKVVEAMRVRVASRAQKQLARKKSALETSNSMPAKLVGCASDDPELIELQICEGDSAMGGLKGARDATFQAIYPLRGKPLNTFNLPLGKVLENTEWADLIQILGAGVLKEFDLNQLNYKRIILLADSDADGSHIRTLLIAGFYKFMRPLLQDGRVFVAQPPLFSITTTGKDKQKYYALNDAELETLVKKLKREKKHYNRIQRHKGLGEYSQDILAEVVMNPETRVLRQITLEDGESASKAIEILSLTMGDRAKERRDWITKNRAALSDDDIDI